MLVLVFLSLLNLAKPGSGNNLPNFEDIGVLRVSEDEKEGFVVGNITATDFEGDHLTMSLQGIGVVILEIVDANEVLNATGPSPLTRFLRLKKQLDREVRNSYKFNLVVKDDYANSNRERYSPDVLLFVSDVNDNAPVFLNTPYVTEIPENTPSSMLFQAKANDVDQQSFVLMFDFTDECKLWDCKPFLIGAVSGIVSLNSTSTLDYETRNRYELDIFVKDGGAGTVSLNSTTTLVVKVLDKSDQSPEFVKSWYRADINENTPVNKAVVQTKAFDGDRGIDNPVQYRIIGGDDEHYFRIDNATGTIFVNSTIDRGVGIDYFKLTVEATEIPGNASSTTTVFITIGHLNDNKPTFAITAPTSSSSSTATESEISNEANNGGTAWYIFFGILVLGLITGVLVSYVLVYCRRRFRNRKSPQKPSDPQPSNNTSIYQDLDLTKMKSEDNYQSLMRGNNVRNEAGPRDDESHYENAS